MTRYDHVADELVRVHRLLEHAETTLHDVSAERDRYLGALRAILAGAPDAVSVAEKALRGRL